MIARHALRIAVILCALPAVLHAQPVAAPVALTLNRSDSIPPKGSVHDMHNVASRSRAEQAKKGLRVGAITGAVAGLVVSQLLLSGNPCELSPPRDRVTGKPICPRSMSRLRYGSLLTVTGGAVGGVLGAGIGAITGGDGTPD